VYVLIINVVSCPPGALIWKIKYLVSCILYVALLCLDIKDKVMIKFWLHLVKNNDKSSILADAFSLYNQTTNQNSESWVGCINEIFKCLNRLDIKDKVLNGIYFLISYKY
jgi:hypothetical protein